MTYAAYAEIRTRDGKILLVRREASPDTWTLPGGPARPSDRDPAWTAVWGVCADTGLGLDVWRLTSNGFAVGDFTDGAAILFFHTVALGGGEALLIAATGHTLACQWFTPAETGDLKMDDAMAAYLQRLRGT